MLCLVAQSCPILCNPVDCSPPGSAVHGILQERILDWVAMLSSRGSSQPRGSNLGLPHCRRILYCLSHQESPRILEWVAYLFSRGSSQPRGSNLGLPHCRQILYCLSHQESPRILEWVAYLFSRGSSQPRDRTRVSCIAGKFFTS